MSGLIRLLKRRFVIVQDRPIIVLGNQKSGTSAIAHLLAEYGNLSRTIDIPSLWPPTGVEIMRGNAHFASAVKRDKASFSTELIKEPMMTFFADQVIEVFPNAKYVFVLRDPRENIRSLLNRRGIPGDKRQLEPRHRPKLEHHKVIADASIWGGENENYIGVLGCRWNKAADAYLQNPSELILAKYEDFVLNKAEYIRALARKLGVRQVNNILDKVDVQYQPRGNRDVAWSDFFGEENLRTIERVCGKRMQIFGYSRSIDVCANET